MALCACGSSAAAGTIGSSSANGRTRPSLVCSARASCVSVHAAKGLMSGLAHTP